MKTLPRSLLLAGLAALLAASASAQSIWTNAGGDYLFSNPANWSGNAVPTDGADLSLATDDLLGLDNGGNFHANSLTIQSGFTGLLMVAGAETLSLGTGGINNLGSGLDFQVGLTVTTSQTWNVGSGAFLLSDTFQVASGAVLTINVGAGASFDFAMNAANPTWLGTINFTGNTAAASLLASGAGFTSQNLGLITIDGVAAQLTGTQLTTSAIPEPSTYALLFGAGVLGLAVLRRRRATAQS